MDAGRADEKEEKDRTGEMKDTVNTGRAKDKEEKDKTGNTGKG